MFQHMLQRGQTDSTGYCAESGLRFILEPLGNVRSSVYLASLILVSWLRLEEPFGIISELLTTA